MSILYGLPVLRKYITVGELSLKYLIVRKMSEWKIEKDKYLSMSLENKRKHYKVKKYVAIQEIPTWKEYVEKQKKLENEIPKNANFEIDSAQNATLAGKISVFHENITFLEADAIVNAANSSLKAGGGVCGAIHNAAGHLLQKECSTLNGCAPGSAKLTGGYNLPASYVIHAIGPQGANPGLLEMCYKSCLDVVTEKKFRTVAFPCISTGIYGFPSEPAAHIAVTEVRKHLEVHSHDIDRVIFCLFTDLEKKVYEGILQSYFPIN